jgi:hypothetical protein
MEYFYVFSQEIISDFYYNEIDKWTQQDKHFSEVRIVHSEKKKHHTWHTEYTFYRL